MLQGTQKLYKLMALYMLQRVNDPVSNSRIVDLFTSLGFTDYFTVQEILNSLEDDDFITSTQKQNITLYSLTERGELSCEKFHGDLGDKIRNDIDEYISHNKLRIKNEVSVSSEYFKNKKGEYTVNCRIKEKSSTLIDLSLSVPLEENAKNICDNWKNKSSDVYKSIIRHLL